MLLVLASSSTYRKSLLQRLGLPFRTATPAVDEKAQPGEAADALAARLALAKAQAVAEQFPNALIIGSDQVAVLAGRLLGKPGSAAQAQQQLTAASGQVVQLVTGLCLYNSQTSSYQLDTVSYRVYLRQLTAQQIRAYVARDQPLDCAGSFKWEKLGIALFCRMEGDDVTALEGLPLIRLVDMLNDAGVAVL